MTQDQTTLQNRYADFVKNVSESEIVYALKGDEGYATSYSSEIEHEDGSAVQTVCFWSDDTIAKSCIENEWSGYNTDLLPLNDFIENWCLGMNMDGIIVGINFDNELTGFEAEPLELILEIIAELKKTGKSLELKKFESINDLESQIKEALQAE